MTLCYTRAALEHRVRELAQNDPERLALFVAISLYANGNADCMTRAIRRAYVIVEGIDTCDSQLMIGNARRLSTPTPELDFDISSKSGESRTSVPLCAFILDATGAIEIKAVGPERAILRASIQYRKLGLPVSMKG